MATDTLIEQRLTAVEKAVNELQRQLNSPPPVLSRIEQISGSFKDEPAFEEVLELGRAIWSADVAPEGFRAQNEVSSGH